MTLISIYGELFWFSFGEPCYWDLQSAAVEHKCKDGRSLLLPFTRDKADGGVCRRKPSQSHCWRSHHLGAVALDIFFFCKEQITKHLPFRRQWSFPSYYCWRCSCSSCKPYLRPLQKINRQQNNNEHNPGHRDLLGKYVGLRLALSSTPSW